MTWLQVVCELARRYQLLGRSRTDVVRATVTSKCRASACCERTGAALEQHAHMRANR